MSERERLTRSELSWLLTQEARGAAERLRKGVQILTKPPPPPPPSSPAPGSERPITLSSTSEEGEGLESSLDALDATMQRLASIYGPTTQRGRRGRVDLAALLWEVAPDAKVNLAPGAGTEIFGDESEFRRMLHVFLGTSSTGFGGAQVVDLKREGELVRLSVALGPDTAPVSPAERGWLSRMAIRYGGRYELEGSVQVLIFPAEDAQEKKEIKELRKELEAAKAQGEAYARELAAVFADPATASSRPPPISASAPPLESAFGFLGPLARVSDAVADDLRAMLSPLGAAKIKMRSLESELASGVENVAMLSLVEKVNDALTKGAELLALMRQLARTGGDIDRIPVDLAAIARDEANAATIAFASRGVVLSIAIGGSGATGGDTELMLQGMPSALRALVAEMLDRALRNSEPGGEVRISLRGRSLVVEGVGDASRDAARSLREGGRSALVFLTEVARAHRIELRVSDASLVATVPEISDAETYGG
jgi:hypothetical protein